MSRDNGPINNLGFSLCELVGNSQKWDLNFHENFINMTISFFFLTNNLETQNFFFFLMNFELKVSLYCSAR